MVEGEFRTQAQAHAYLEPCAALVEVDDTGTRSADLVVTPIDQQKGSTTPENEYNRQRGIRAPAAEHALEYERQTFTCPGCERQFERVVDANGRRRLIPVSNFGYPVSSVRKSGDGPLPSRLQRRHARWYLRYQHQISYHRTADAGAGRRMPSEHLGVVSINEGRLHDGKVVVEAD